MIEASFNRVSPARFAEKIGIPLGWVVINHRHISGKAERRQVHGEWFEISSGTVKIYRMLRFSPNLRKGDATSPGSIVIDWIGWIDLQNRDEGVKGPLTLKLRRVPWWKLPFAYLKHPDPAIRLSGWLGWISIIMGAVSLLLTVPFGWLADQILALRAYLPMLSGC